jgi:hypothetical protein
MAVAALCVEQEGRRREIAAAQADIEVAAAGAMHVADDRRRAADDERIDAVAGEGDALAGGRIGELALDADHPGAADLIVVAAVESEQPAALRVARLPIDAAVQVEAVIVVAGDQPDVETGIGRLVALGLCRRGRRHRDDQSETAGRSDADGPETRR